MRIVVSFLILGGVGVPLGSAAALPQSTCSGLKQLLDLFFLF
jgi:hypothetical protein